MAHKKDVDPTTPRPTADCGCGWQAWAAGLEAKLEVLVGEIDALKRQVFGKKSEKMPPMDREVRKAAARGPSGGARAPAKERGAAGQLPWRPRTSTPGAGGGAALPQVREDRPQEGGQGQGVDRMELRPWVLPSLPACARDAGLLVRAVHRDRARTRPFRREHALR